MWERGGFQKFAVAHVNHGEYARTMTAISKKIVINERGEPQEVIIPWAQFCELSEVLGLDLDATAQAELREAIEDSRARRREAFTPLDEL